MVYRDQWPERFRTLDKTAIFFCGSFLMANRIKPNVIASPRQGIHHCMRRRLPTRKGASAIELALVAPFVFLLLLGSFEFARVMAVNQALTNAARASCRKASLATTNDPEVARQLAYDSLCGLVPVQEANSSLVVTVTPATLQGLPSGTPITATVEIQAENITWLPPMFVAGSTMKATVSGRRE